MINFLFDYHQLGAIALLCSVSVLLFAQCILLASIPKTQVSIIFRSFLIELCSRFINRKQTKTNKQSKQFAKQNNAKFHSTTQESWLAAINWFINYIQRFIKKTLGVSDHKVLLNIAMYSFIANAILASIAILLLLILLVNNDLLNRYVVLNSTRELSIFYRLTALWAGSAGSMLLWYWITSILSVTAIIQVARRFPQRLWSLMQILLWAQILFAVLLIFASDAQPFRTFPQQMLAGRGINPLLLHWAMIIHPPILYIGYIGTLIPFAIIMSGLFTKDQQTDVGRYLRRWLLFSWFFLGCGILLGSKWAYEELGWGGYWAWDPVENASIMPWLVGTAFIHSFMVYERCRQLTLWTFVLAILFYHFSLLGTWITRSGILSGPHTFAESSIGWPLLIFTLWSLFYYISRLVFYQREAKSNSQKKTPVHLSSKEGSMLLNNLFMIFIVALILFGIFSPLLPIDCNFSAWFFGEALQCQPAQWKESAYNRIIIPIAVLTIFFMGLSPMLTWRRKASERVYTKILSWPLVIGLACSMIYLLFYMIDVGWFLSWNERNLNRDISLWQYFEISLFFGVLTIGICGFALTIIVQELYSGIRSRQIRFQESIFHALGLLVLRNKRRYVGYLFHLSILLLFIGYSGGIFKSSSRLEFFYTKIDTPNRNEIVYYSQDRATVSNYEFSAHKLVFRPQFRSEQAQDMKDFIIEQTANFQIKNNKNNMYSLATGRLFFPQIDPVTARVIRDQQLRATHTPTSEPDIISFLHEDIYVQLGAVYNPNSTHDGNLNHMFESYYFIFERKAEARDSIFPLHLVADVQIWINPLVQFIWLGSLLFFLAGLLILLPYGEPKYLLKKSTFKN